MEDSIINLIDIKDFRNINEHPDKLGILLKKNLLIFIIIKDNNNYVNKIISNIIEDLNKNYTLDKIINNMIDKLVFNNFNPIEHFENKIIDIENELLKNKLSQDLNPLIFSIKKQLFLIKRYYDYILNFITEIKNNIGNIFNKENLKQFSILENRITRLSNNTQYLIENTIHLREIYQSSLDFNQNKIIKLLTLITTIFLPLSLITSWYGMNFEYMPEIHFKYMYPIIIIISILISFILLIILKKKKIL